MVNFYLQDEDMPAGEEEDDEDEEEEAGGMEEGS